MGSAHSKNASVDEEGKIALRLANYAATTASSNGKNVLATVEQATLLAHEPHLQEAATLAVALLDMIPRLRGNKSAFRSLATDACDLVYAVMNSYEKCDKQGGAFPRGIVHFLQVSLQQIKEEVESVASRGLFSGFLSRGDDAERIKKCKEDSQRYLRMLELQSHITIRQAVSHIQGQTNAILAAVNAQPSLRYGSTHPSLNTSTKETINSINGNCVVNNSTTNISSTNSGKVFTISINDSNHSNRSRRANVSTGSRRDPNATAVRFWVTGSYFPIYSSSCLLPTFGETQCITSTMHNFKGPSQWTPCGRSFIHPIALIFPKRHPTYPEAPIMAERCISSV
ncbi:hypothetical protein AB1N83_009293 [Pleurotus pulmonarius]